MSSFDDLFNDVDKVGQPRQLNKNKFNPQTADAVLFRHKDEALTILQQVQDNIHDMAELYSELGDGKLSQNGLTIQRRNQIIDTLSDYQKNIENLTESFNKKLQKDIVQAKSMKVHSSTDISAFDKLLGDKQPRNLTSKDISFQRTQ